MQHKLWDINVLNKKTNWTTPTYLIKNNLWLFLPFFLSEKRREEESLYGGNNIQRKGLITCLKKLPFGALPCTLYQPKLKGFGSSACLYVPSIMCETYKQYGKIHGWKIGSLGSVLLTWSQHTSSMACAIIMLDVNVGHKETINYWLVYLNFHPPKTFGPLFSPTYHHRHHHRVSFGKVD